MTSIEACEEDPRMAMRVNSAAPGKIALWAAERKVRVIHFSTDYVFRGDLAHKLTENDIADPLNVYGRQKRMAELAVLSNHPRATVMRVSWVYGGKVPAFVEGCMERLRMGEDIDAIADKWSIPTAMPDLCEWVNFLLHEQPASLLHGCHSGPPVSWYGIALYLSELFGKASSSAISPKALADASHFVAPRPIHTAMDNQLLSTMLPSAIADWREVMSRAMNFR
jgi:dTDP-4-dehydrorhamnose reductase